MTGWLDKAKATATQVKDSAVTAAAGVAASVSDPDNQEAAKQGLGSTAESLASSTRAGFDLTKKAMGHMVDKIDPDMLADLVFKATLVQERVNQRLRGRQSPYRISSIAVTVALPPNISFEISRIGDIDGAGEVLTAGQLDAAEIEDIASVQGPGNGNGSTATPVVPADAPASDGS